MIKKTESKQSTDYGMMRGHYASSRQAGYLKTHTRCTKGHGWTIKGEFGGCAICEKEHSSFLKQQNQ